jgi:thiol-disulfide isomerase/thioredoxin
VDAKIADGFDQVKWQGVSLGDISFPDLNGKLHALDDPIYDGKIKLVQIFGSWCPNCHDASLFLSQLQADYADKGLSIVGLAFEITGDFERDKLQIQEYRKRTGCTYPILIAGLSEKKKAAGKLKLLDKVKSYPTSIFLDANNQPIAIHSGFSGPATGDAYLQLQQRFRGIIEDAVSD